MSRLLILLFSAILLSACSLFTPKTITNTNQPVPPPAGGPTPMPTPTPQTNPIATTSAIIKTSLGDITVQLFPDKAPNTVANFLGLADGSKSWTDPKTQTQTNTPLYANTIFHRAIKDFMIQGGDPLGNGTGGPGYRFADEIDSSLTFSQPYLLAMANAGPNTNGSQFFITTVPTPWLNGKHTIFGKVVAGQDIVDKIVNTPTDSRDKPLTDIVIKEITLSP